MITMSLHGGHSGQFCDHAQDTLAEIVAAYHEQGFCCVGLSEHMPPVDDHWLYPDEMALGRNAEQMLARFADYVREARQLAQSYAQDMTILVGMETEWYPGCATWVQQLRDKFDLDYLVGSLHHVQGICFDFSSQAYAQVMEVCGGLVPLYCAYFDAQWEMLTAIHPQVVGHFDLIRIFDPHYTQTLTHSDVWPKVRRNLEYIQKYGALLDINARGLAKGAAEPYVSALILEYAATLGIAVAYGDDAHGVRDVGYGRAEVAAFLVRYGLKEASITLSPDSRKLVLAARQST
ncbi:MAG: histidinol-phosphatase [Desulfovibrionales bacterium]|nr:histidinol-phosphatase [Desulfovibrionales bacterium]